MTLRRVTTARHYKVAFIATDGAEGLEFAPAENPWLFHNKWVKTLGPCSGKSGKNQT